MASTAVVVINYNTCNQLRACLESVVAAQPDEIVVVDNASSDGSAAMVRDCFPQVRLYANSENVGFGTAANQAITNCTAPAILLLNSDTVVTSGAVRALADYLGCHPRAGIVGPRLLSVDGTIQASCFPFPTPFNVFLELSSLSGAVQWLPVVRERYPRTWSYNRPHMVDWVLGAALLIRREAFEAVQGFDERFFMYHEEVDLCYRLQAAGWQTHYTPDASVMHVGGASTSQDRVAMAVHLYTSMFTMYRHHYSFWQLQQLRLVFIIGLAAKMTRDLSRLCYTSDPARQHQLREDVRIWRHVLSKSAARMSD